MAETQEAAAPAVQVTDRADLRVTMPNVERVVRDIPETRQIVREMSRSERVEAAAKTFTSAREPKTETKPTAETKPIEKPAAEAKPEVEAKPEPEKPAVEAKPKTDEKPAEAKPDEKLAKRYADIADRERRANAKIAAEKQAIAAERAAVAEAKKAADEFKALRENAAKDPQAFLKATGLTFEQFARAFIADKKKPADAPATETKPALSEEEIEKRVLAKLEARRAEETKQSQAAERERVRNGVAAQVSASEKYPGLKLLGAEGEVFDYAMAVYEKGDPRRGLKPGTRLELDKAAELMETVARQEAERRFGPERVQAFIEAGKKTSETQPEAKPNGKPNGTGSPARADAGSATKTAKVTRKERAQDGRFASKTPNGGAASASEEDSELSYEEHRALERQKATEIFAAKMRK